MDSIHIVIAYKNQLVLWQNIEIVGRTNYTENGKLPCSVQQAIEIH